MGPTPVRGQQHEGAREPLCVLPQMSVLKSKSCRRSCLERLPQFTPRNLEAVIDLLGYISATQCHA